MKRWEERKEEKNSIFHELISDPERKKLKQKRMEWKHKEFLSLPLSFSEKKEGKKDGEERVMKRERMMKKNKARNG